MKVEIAGTQFQVENVERMAWQRKNQKIKVMDLPIIRLKIVGDTTLICHRWDGSLRSLSVKDWRESLYKHPDGGFGFPVAGFKKCVVQAAHDMNMKMTQVRKAFHILGDIAKIRGKPQPNESSIRLPGCKPSLHYRGEFPKWTVDLLIQYNPYDISDYRIVDLFNIAGYGTGVGEWRPERNGQFGRFHVAFDKMQ